MGHKCSNIYIYAYNSSEFNSPIYNIYTVDKYTSLVRICVSTSLREYIAILHPDS